ncbi:MAG: hypothetical protein H5T44_05885 [Thermoplasmatales archaeon]|nr:hypothetical protein [Thermoplasmatales archaeon]
MWLITTLIFAIIATILHISIKKYRLNYLALMLWGAFLMIFVDHVLGYEGGAFLEYETEGLINNGIILGIVMLIPVLIIWLALVVIEENKR